MCDFRDNMTTHFTASISAASVATALAQPVDVMKTRMMNAAPGTYSGKRHHIVNCEYRLSQSLCF